MVARAARPATLGLALAVALVLALAGCDDATPVLFDAPAQVQAHPAGDGASTGDGVVGEVVADPPGVRVLDARGNAATGARVTFRVVAGEGEVGTEEVRADAEGIARPRNWVLGPTMGQQTVEARAPGVGEVRLHVEARAGPPGELTSETPPLVSGPVGVLLAEPATVRVRDRFGNPVRGQPVEFVVTEGGGEVAPTTATTDETGRARIESWTLGPDPGLNQVEARVEGTAPLVLELEGMEAPPLRVAATHLNQANLGLTGGPAVAGRGGLLRVFPVGGLPGGEPARVRITLVGETGALRSEEVVLAAPPAPAQPAVGQLGASWNLELEPHEVQVGMGLRVDLLLADGSEVPLLPVPDDDEATPDPNAVEPLPVEALPPLRLVLFPIQTTVQGLTGSITEANAEAFLADTRRWIPATEIEWEVRPPFVTDGDMATFAGWRQTLEDLQAARGVEGATDEYYHGIVPDFPGIGFGGLAYLLPSPSHPSRSGLTYDRLPQASGTLAHELGHNMGRRHAPCGGPAQVDLNFPHANAGIGGPGWDVLDREVRFPTGHHDYMSYCGPRWTSDYTWEGILEWRRDDPLAAPVGQPFAVAAGVRSSGATSTPFAGAAPAPAAEPGLLVWGGVTDEGVALRSAVSLEAPPTRGSGSGPHRLQGLAEDGTVLFEARFGTVPLDHAPDVAHFSLVVPVGEADQARLHALEVTGPAGQVRREVGGEPAVVLLREPATGRVRGIVHPRTLGLDAPSLDEVERRPEILRAPPGDAPRRAPGVDLPPGLELIVSDGVRSRVIRP